MNSGINHLPASCLNRFFRSLVTRKERWGLSWRGRAVTASAFLLVSAALMLSIHPFLAVTHRVPTKVLVVEGWTHNYGVKAAVEEFKTGRYDRLLTTGGPVSGYGPSSSIYDTDAYQSARLLKQAGLPDELVQSIPSLFVGRDRTYNSAVALRHWLLLQNLPVGSLNVLTEDAHARRTWLLFQDALGPGVQVGIISMPNPDYDAKHWWRSSEGVREIIDESVAYLYARFLFWPPTTKEEI